MEPSLKTSLMMTKVSCTLKYSKHWDNPVHFGKTSKSQDVNRYGEMETYIPTPITAFQLFRKVQKEVNHIMHFWRQKCSRVSICNHVKQFLSESSSCSIWLISRLSVGIISNFCDIIYANCTSHSPVSFHHTLGGMSSCSNKPCLMPQYNLNLK